MTAKIENLARVIEAEKAEGEKFCLMLGAGASLSSGVKPTLQIMEELLDEYGRDLRRGSVEARFDQLWERTPESQRGVFLNPLLEGHEPSPGYLCLAELIAAGYFDLVLTFNYDDLVEKALRRRGFNDFKVIIRGETRDEMIANLIDKKKPRVKIVKLHGSLRSTDTFLFTEGEVNEYPPEIRAMVNRITHRHLITCGYAFEDFAVVEAFSKEGGSVYCVNPSGAPKRLRPALQARRSQDNVIAGERGKFDRFFEELRRNLMAPGGDKPGLNPFKYLDGYGRDDAEWFLGREEQAERVQGFLQDDEVRILTLSGPRKAGKSSFVRAGVLARLDPGEFDVHYVRCKATSVDELIGDIKRASGAVEDDGEDLAATLDRLAAADNQVVLVLDQFEKFIRGYEDGETRDKVLAAFEALVAGRAPNLTVVLVVREYGLFWKLLWKININPKHAQEEEIEPLTSEQVGEVVRKLAHRVDMTLDDRVIVDLAARYRDQNGESFTLAHVQAICYLMARHGRADWDTYEATLMNEREPLDRVINHGDVMGFVEDLPERHQRILLRNLMKLISRDSRLRLAEISTSRGTEMLCDGSFPERIGEEVA